MQNHNSSYFRICKLDVETKVSFIIGFHLKTQSKKTTSSKRLLKFNFIRRSERQTECKKCCTKVFKASFKDKIDSIFLTSTIYATVSLFHLMLKPQLPKFTELFEDLSLILWIVNENSVPIHNVFNTIRSKRNAKTGFRQKKSAEIKVIFPRQSKQTNKYSANATLIVVSVHQNI